MPGELSRTRAHLHQGPSENQSLLTMLDDNPVLRKLIGTWPNAWRVGAKKHEQITTWAALTLLREVEVEASWRALFENGFCRKDGTVDPLAARYVASFALSRLPASVRVKPKKEAGGGADK